MEYEFETTTGLSNIENFDPAKLSYTRAVPSYRPRAILKDITPKLITKAKDNVLMKNVLARKKVGGLR